MLQADALTRNSKLIPNKQRRLRLRAVTLNNLACFYRSHCNPHIGIASRMRQRSCISRVIPHAGVLRVVRTLRRLESRQSGWKSDMDVLSGPRRRKKLHSALRQLEEALGLELMCEEGVQGPAGTHLNICAVGSLSTRVCDILHSPATRSACMEMCASEQRRAATSVSDTWWSGAGVGGARAARGRADACEECVGPAAG